VSKKSGEPAKPAEPPSTTPAGLRTSPTLPSQVLAAQARALLAASGWLAGPGEADFARAVELVVACADAGGTVLVSGLGKSGLVGAKIAATLSSLGIPAHAVHPSEAAHGDLGRFRPQDTVICLSKSGETDEVVNLAAILRQDGLPIVAITAPGAGTDALSSLERLATVVLRVPLDREAGEPRFLAPTSSTTVTMAMGDALALAAADRRAFTDADFRRRHPGGSLGGLLRPVVEMLRFRAGQGLPLVPEGVSVGEALRRADTPGRRPGAMVIIDPESGRLTGIFTDGDLRRLVLRDPAAMNAPIESVMTRSPRTLPAGALVRDAVTMVREFRQDEIPVVGPSGEPVGILDVQDLIAMRLVKD
jgi:arabinose-5-phosphate isomerase